MSDSLDLAPKRPPRKTDPLDDSLDGSASPVKKKADPLGGSGSRIKRNDPMDDPLGGSGSRVKKKDPLDDPLGGSGSRIKKKDPLDDPLGGSGSRVKKMDPMDGPLSDSVPRSQRKGPPANLKGSLTLDDMDGSIYENILKKEAPRRTLSSELESSLVIGESNWKTMETVHARYEDDLSDSDSFMGDSFAGSSFHTQESWIGEPENDLPFSPMDDESAKSADSGARKMTPRRTYSKQSKRMPKKMDPLSAITEVGDNDDNDDEECDDSF